MNLSFSFAAASLAAFLVFTPAAFAQNAQNNTSNNHDTAKGAAVGCGRRTRNWLGTCGSGRRRWRCHWSPRSQEEVAQRVISQVDSQRSRG